MTRLIWLVFGAVILIVLLGLYYLATRVRKFHIVQKFSKGKRWLIRILCVIPILIIVAVGILDAVNTVVVVMHLIVFWLLCDFIGVLTRKLAKRQCKFYWQGILAIAVTAIYMGIGWYNVHHVRETDYRLETNKDLGVDFLRVVQISDSHIGTTFGGDGFAKHMETIQKTNPDIVVITGDYVDDDTDREDMIKSCKALGKLKTTYGVFFVYGNHDKGYSNYRNFTVMELKEELEKNNVIILEDRVALIDDRIYLIGRQDRSVATRANAEELVKELDTSKYMIILNHQPNDYDAEEKTEVDLVLSGHTHGGQFFPIGITGELSGVNDKTYGLEVRNKTAFIVNSGISDWALQFKTATFSEFGVIDIVMR